MQISRGLLAQSVSGAGLGTTVHLLLDGAQFEVLALSDWTWLWREGSGVAGGDEHLVTGEVCTSLDVQLSRTS